MPEIAEGTQGGRRDAPDKGKLRVFISYSRDDRDFADQLDAALESCGFDCVLDREGIGGGEDWKQRLGSLISETDTVVFVLSPASARSGMCDWEVKEAMRLGKRVLPIICRPLEDASPPSELRDLNYTYFYAEPKVQGSGFGSGLKILVAALNTDFDWLRAHTRYLERALEWSARGRAKSRLLSDDDVAEARAWVARRPTSAPEPTALQLDFIHASEEEAEARLNAERQQLERDVAMQAERALALKGREEALEQAAAALRKKAKIRNFAFGIVTALAIFAGYLYQDAEQQRRDAEEQRQQAYRMLSHATDVIAATQSHMDDDSKKKAVAIFQMGAGLGDDSAMRNLATAYNVGIGVVQDYGKAREWYERAAEAGNADAMYSLGVLYYHGRGVGQSYVIARVQYEKAADRGDSDALTSLGALYQNGHGVEQDYIIARTLYEKAIDKGNVVAMFNLGLLYDSGGKGLDRDYANARQWYEKAADKGDVSAMTNLGLLYHKGGQGLDRDYANARQWYEKAADKGGVNAMANLGLLYRNGLGVDQDYAKAHHWFEKAADTGDVEAMVNLGEFYTNGLGVARDYTKARQWYEKAADKGNAGAIISLGVIYTEGLGVAQDYIKARNWYEKGIDQDNPDAMINLGMLYANGLGVKRDRAKARELYERAKAKDHPDAATFLEGLVIDEAAASSRYAEALARQEALTEKVEADETNRAGAPGKETADMLTRSAWFALFCKSYEKALTFAGRAHSLLPDNLVIETNRAHALMFLDRREEAAALYLGHKGKPVGGDGGELWEQIIANDFADLRKVGIDHPMMVEMETKLGVPSADGGQPNVSTGLPSTSR